LVDVPEPSVEALQFLDTFGKYTLSLIARDCMPGDQQLHVSHAQFDVGHIGSNVAPLDEQQMLFHAIFQRRNIVGLKSLPKPFSQEPDDAWAPQQMVISCPLIVHTSFAVSV
jgi:hypothetical protein